jgi:hypothetical protein
MHLNKIFLLYFIEILMVSNLGIEMDNAMLKLRPRVDMELCGSGQFLNLFFNSYLRHVLLYRK